MELCGHPDNLAAFKRGDKAVLTALYRAHVAAVSTLVRRGFSFNSKGKMLRFRGFDEPSLLQEIVQESFLRAFKDSARERYDGQRAFAPYLMGITKNYIIDEVRRSQTFAQYFVQLGALMDAQDEGQIAYLERVKVDDGLSSPELLATRRQLQSSLSAFLEQLDPIEAQIVEDHMLGPLGQEEIADALGISRNDVRKHIRIIRERLLKHLKAGGFIGSLEVSEVFKSVLVTMIAG